MREQDFEKMEWESDEYPYMLAELQSSSLPSDIEAALQILISADFRERVNFQFLNLAQLKLNSVKFEELEKCKLKECKLYEANLEGAHLFDAHLEGAHLILAHL